jgi:DNA-binding beta-propeller fold protein YncE
MVRNVYLGCFVGALSVLGAGCAAEQADVSEDSPAIVAAESSALQKKYGDGDTLYVADVADDSVKRFDVKTGEFKGTFVSSASGGLFGPRGLIFDRKGELLVVNQNVDQPFAGEVLTYQRKTGAFVGSLVSHTNPDAPYAPRGIVQKGSKIYVADMGEPGYVLADQPPPNPFPARVAVYDKSGQWLQDLDYEGFDYTCTPEAGCVQWSPRSLVFGPDGALYVSLMKFVSGQDPNLEPGRVIRIDECGDVKVLVDGETCNCGLSRPEGLVFGPRGKLYVTSFRQGEQDTDKVLVFDGKTGKYLDKIDLYTVGAPRAFAEAIVFGPGDKLYVPISGGGPDTGSVRRYDVHSKRYEVAVPAGGALVAPWYLIFGATNSATLGFEGGSNGRH